MKRSSTVHEDTEHLMALIDRRGGRVLWSREKDGRWYQAQVLVDLFDTTEIRLDWGGPRRSRGGYRSITIDGIAEPARRTLVRRLCQRRAWHGYVRRADS
jgi:hypothetical protein